MRLPSQAPEHQARVLREGRRAILDAWVGSLRPAGGARERPALEDEAASLLERIAADLTGEAGPSEHGPVRIHAGEGVDVREVLAELRTLRERVLEAWAAEGVLDTSAVRSLDGALDDAADEAARGIVDAHAALLRGVDAISRASLESRSADELIVRLLDAFVAASRDVDTAAVLLRDGDALRVRAAFGVAEERRGEAVRLGEGFAGAVAAERRPKALADAASSPLVEGDVLRAHGLRALYGVPLVHDGELVGVAEMGSVRASAFRPEDIRLFESMASRAGLGVARHVAADAARRAARDREEARALLEAVFDAAPIGIAFWDRELRFVRVNRWLAETNGMPAAAHLGKTPRQLFPDLEGLDAVMARWRELIETGQPWIGAEIMGETAARPGERRTWREDFFPVRVAGEIVGLGGVVLDVTEEQRGSAELSLLARLSRDLVEELDLEPRLRRAAEVAVPEFADWCVLALVEGGVPLGVAFHAADPAADAAREILEADPLDLAAPHGIGRVLREGAPELVPAVDRAFLRGAVSSDVARRALERIGLRSYLAVPLYAPGGAISGALAFGVAESGRRFDERSLRFAGELARRISLAIDNARLFEAARREARVREQVLAIVSHDLRNPLSTIVMSARKLDAAAAPGADGDLLRRTTDVVRRAAARMERLINDLLDVAAIQGGSLAVSPEPRAPGELVREAVEAMQPMARERQVALAVDPAPGLPDVLADRDRILQVLGNLVSNAIKVTAPGGRIGVRAEARADLVRFAVADTGPGIAPEDQQELFEPYRRGSSAEYHGTGLGLAICRGIVAAHRGEIGVESSPGAGATFWFTLRMASAGGGAVI